MFDDTAGTGRLDHVPVRLAEAPSEYEPQARHTPFGTHDSKRLEQASEIPPRNR
jgi:hypothetical protein